MPKNERQKRIGLSVNLSEGAIAELKTRAASMTSELSVDIKPAALAAGLVHTALGFTPDGFARLPPREPAGLEEVVSESYARDFQRVLRDVDPHYEIEFMGLVFVALSRGERPAFAELAGRMGK